MRNVYQYRGESEDDQDHSVVNNVDHKIQISRVAFPKPKPNLMDSKHSERIRPLPNLTLPLPSAPKHLSPSGISFLSLQSLPAVSPDCDSFYSQELNLSYNPEYYGGIEEKYKVAICTKVKNEAKYIEEWLLYYWLILRVSHFYIYDDGSEDNLEQILHPYINKGIVTYIFWNQNRTVDEELLLPEPQFTKDQRFCIAHCTTNFKDSAQWLAFWDIDEFVYLPEGHENLPKLLDTYVAEREWDNILIPWAVFGSSNHSEAPGGLVMNSYRWRYSLLQFGVSKSGGKFHGKVLYKSKCIPLAAVHLEDMTSKKCVKGDYPVKFDRDLEGYPIHMKHYWSKSFQDYKFKLGKWQNAHWFRTELKQLEELAFEERMTKEGFHAKYDVDMLEFVPRLTHALECTANLREKYVQLS
eukprot:Phypoly_transcript_06142.p1 GENE.Phypoly_transcript_06142~~Phypoly_transcript_06142.p1  ORF type:complete len:442 (+),score=55.82 Phypoly_transcript_06142:96-1328(+)